MEVNSENNMNFSNIAMEDQSMNSSEVFKEKDIPINQEKMNQESDSKDNKSEDINHNKEVNIASMQGAELNEVSKTPTKMCNGEINKETGDPIIPDDNSHSPVKKFSRTRLLQPLIDSDTSEDEADNIRNIGELNEESAISEPNSRKIEDSPDKTQSEYAIMKSRLKALCDSESSEDEREAPYINSAIFKETKYGLSKKKNNSKKPENPKGKKMTAKEYEAQKLEIKSESQRIERERDVYLPYHRPKPRSLKEFLEKRPRFTAALADKPGKTPTILAAIKMTNQNLKNISKKLEDRQKMLKDFYKSESESGEEDEDKVNKSEDEAALETNLEQTNIIKEIAQNVEINHSECDLEQNNENNHEEMNTDEISTKVTNSSIEIISNIIIQEGETEQRNNSLDYEFSLQNVELSESIADSSNAVEDSSLNDSDSAPPKKNLNRLQLLKEAVGKSTPKLSGDPNEVINFDEDVPTRSGAVSGVDRLIQRFINHTTKRTCPKDDSVQVDILTLSGGKLHKEVLTMQLHGNSSDEPVAVLETPGAKLKKLRTELQSQMALRRSEMWKQKNVLENVPTTFANDGSRDYEEGADYDILDDEEEYNIDDEEEEDDEELIEDDVDMREKRAEGIKSDFIEDEAELSDAEDAAIPDDEDDEDSEEEMDDEEAENNKMYYSTCTQSSGKKKLKRIITIDDSEDENENEHNAVTPIGPLDSTDSWEDEEDDLLLPNAQRPPSRQRTPQLIRTKSSTGLGFITPVRQLTALQSLQSFDNSLNDDQDDQQQIQDPKQQQKDLLMSPIVPLPPDPSPLRGNTWHRHLLFPECNEESTVNMEELANEICSGKFPNSSASTKNDADLYKPSFNTVMSSQPSTQDVLDICSGNFTCTTQNNQSTSSKSAEQDEFANNTQINDQIHTDAIKKSIITEEIVFKHPTLECLDDDDDKIISQLLDEEEMDKFKKKFESPVNVIETSNIPPFSPIRGRIMFDTSDEDEHETDHQNRVKILTKRRPKKCLIEDSDEEDQHEIEDNEEDDEADEADDYEEHLVDYDSEENEVDASVVKAGLNINDFLENEAELSESEWGSADEDEKGLDELDIEVCDEEKFDEQKLRTGIERVQLRQMLDDDNKELKILQEMLLEDGELHGAGRERQFRWRNIDDTFDLETAEGNEKDEEYLDDGVDSEEIWRKKRHERVLFLQSQKKSGQAENDLILSSNNILKLGQKAIVRNATNTSQNCEDEVKNPQQKVSLTVKQPFSLLNKRGSFLSRGEKVLAKVAEFTKTENISAKGPTKFSRNFLFSTILSDSDLDHTKKRKADDGTPIAIKKLRLNNLSPATNRVLSKTSAKKLFQTT